MNTGRNRILYLLLGWLVFTIAVPVAIWVGELIPTEYANGEKLVQAIVTSAIVIPIVYLLGKRRWDKEIFKKMRISTTIRGVSTMFFVFFVVICISLIGFFLLVKMNDIDNVTIHWSKDVLGMILFTFVVAFFYEALPEEIVFRGFLSKVLEEKWTNWIVLFGSAFLFLASPVTMFYIQKMFGMPTNEITTSYVILIFSFGIALLLITWYFQNLWASIGFHMGYLMSSRFIMNNDERAIFNFTEEENGLAFISVQYLLVVVGSIIILTILLLIKKRKIRSRDFLQ
ncbi:CPBP family intramembrane glutamic endopeptidase [Paenibacillus sp. FA6]|uniref:CPBP family intramembrane glutamic endopeptidase n=1 Tax=Paenibacillus sp. FA6 TaxID=3413029 RepID=UPI003F655CCC